jgi:dipeptidase
LKYSYMIKDIQKVQSELEGNAVTLQPIIERTALELNKTNPEIMTKYLTDYCVTHAEMVVDRWRRLGEDLMVKYNDGYVKDSTGRPQDVGYPEGWLRKVVRSRPEQFKLPVKEEATPESELID